MNFSDKFGFSRNQNRPRHDPMCVVADETFTVQSRHQQNELAIMFQSWVVSIVVSTCFAVGLYCFSIKKESEVKSNIIKRRFFTMDKSTSALFSFKCLLYVMLTLDILH